MKLTKNIPIIKFFCSLNHFFATIKTRNKKKIAAAIKVDLDWYCCYILFTPKSNIHDTISPRLIGNRENESEFLLRPISTENHALIPFE